MTSITPILHAASQTYANYPSLQAPWLLGDFTLPAAVTIPLFLLGVAAPFVMGLVTARLVGPKDRWAAVSAGLTTAATASLVAYVLWIGWAVTIATVIVPSISDLTLFANSTRAPAEASAHPSDVLTDPYPDLKATPADDRGQLLFPKIVSDQVVGSAYGVWCGVAVAVATVGVPGFCGSLAGAWILRHGGRWWAKLFSYVELTVATAVPVGLLVAAAPVVILVGVPMEWLRFAALAAASAVVVLGASKRWAWTLRLTAAFAWVMVLVGVGFTNRISLPTTLASYVVYAGLAALLVRHWHLRRAAQPPVPSATRLVMPA